MIQAAMAHRDTSVSDLCRELRISPVTLYRYGRSAEGTFETTGNASSALRHHLALSRNRPGVGKCLSTATGR